MQASADRSWRAVCRTVSTVRSVPRVPFFLRYRCSVDDEDREVGYELTDELVILPDTTTDDTDAGWGERASTNDDRLLADRPPHWA